jgi:hypothetical protein
MIYIKNEFRISLSVAFFAGIVVPFLYEDELGIFTSIFLSLASLCLFYVFAIMPLLLKQKHTDLDNQYHPIYHKVAQKKKAEAFFKYQGDVKLWIFTAVFLIVVGVIGFAVIH